MRNRLTLDEAKHLLEYAPLIELMQQADEVRRQLNPGNEVSFVIDTNPNYTNVCVTDCTFCSFYRKPSAADAWTLSPEDIAVKARSAYDQGATTILLQGGHNPDLKIDYFLRLVEQLMAAVPQMHLHLFSPAEIEHIANVSEMSSSQVLQALYDAGLRTMPGGGAEILVDRIRRQISPKKMGTEKWLDIMRQAHGIGFRTSATMTYGHRESPADVVEHLMRLRSLQDETGGFYAFIPWSFKPGASPLSRIVPDAAPPSYYLRVIAIARLVLDNVPHIQASWFGEGRRAGQLALRAGADDFGGLLLEENVLFQAQHQEASSLDEVLGLIREAGFVPVQRTTTYDIIARYDVASPGESANIRRSRTAGIDAHAPARERKTA